MNLFNTTTYPSNDGFSKMTNTVRLYQPPVDILSVQQGRILRLVHFVILSSLIALPGVAANAINMIVFYRQGFNTTTNISFFALAISDMVCLVTALCDGVFFNPYLETSSIHFVPSEVQHMSVGWLHVCFGRITSWITVFITAERCLGITLPLKVKQIITLRRTTIVMCLIFGVHLTMLLPEYVIEYLDWKFVPAKNRTLFGIVYRSYKDSGYGLIYTMTSTSGMMSFLCVILLTTFLVTQLERKSKWRKQATGGSDNSESVSSRDKKTMKMIVMIASVLIVCYIPGTITSLVSSFVPEFMVDRAFDTSYFSCWSIAFVFDNINSSINVFLYFRMSTKYRQTFNVLFSRCVKTDAQTLSNIADR